MKDYSNYWNTNINDRIKHYGKKILDMSLDGFESKEVIVDDLTKKLLIQEKYSANNEGSKRTIIGEYGSFKWGSVIKYNGNSWISTSFPLSENGIYDKGIMELCNDILVLESDPHKVKVGNDPIGRPIYEEIKGDIFEIPCSTTTTITNSSEEVWFSLPGGKIQITIPFVDHDKLKINTDIKLQKSTFKISGVDYSNTINKCGIIKITAEKILGVD